MTNELCHICCNGYPKLGGQGWCSACHGYMQTPHFYSTRNKVNKLHSKLFNCDFLKKYKFYENILLFNHFNGVINSCMIQS